MSSVQGQCDAGNMGVGAGVMDGCVVHYIRPL